MKSDANISQDMQDIFIIYKLKTNSENLLQLLLIVVLMKKLRRDLIIQKIKDLKLCIKMNLAKQKT
jgi:hypothetical protein